MATKGKSISNKLTGEIITWVETSKDSHGKHLLFDIEIAPKGFVPVRHFHPNQNEHFKIYSGKLRSEVNGQTKELEAGGSIMIPKAVPHQWWNDSETEPVKMQVKIEPALNTEVFFEQFFGLSNDGKTKKDGSFPFLQIMTMSNTYEIYLAGPPLFVQKLMGFVFGSIGSCWVIKNTTPSIANKGIRELH